MYLLQLILFANRKCHGYAFTMYSNLLDLLVQKLEIALERRLIKRKEENRSMEEALERREREVSLLSDRKQEMELLTSK